MTGAVQQTQSPRKFEGDTLVLATHNAGKRDELQRMFGDYPVTLKTAADFGVDAPPETGTTFIENALIKAQTVAAATGLPALADDSGLCVNALNGAPGVYSADWAELPDGSRDFGAAIVRLQNEMGDAADRSAYFASVIVLAWPDGHFESVEGIAPGSIIFPPRGRGGHGYDPVFVQNGFDLTYAELTPAEKNAISHRSAAFRAIFEKCFR